MPARMTVRSPIPVLLVLFLSLTPRGLPALPPAPPVPLFVLSTPPTITPSRPMYRIARLRFARASEAAAELRRINCLWGTPLSVDVRRNALINGPGVSPYCFTQVDRPPKRERAMVRLDSVPATAADSWTATVQLALDASAAVEVAWAPAAEAGTGRRSIRLTLGPDVKYYRAIELIRTEGEGKLRLAGKAVLGDQPEPVAQASAGGRTLTLRAEGRRQDWPPSVGEGFQQTGVRVASPPPAGSPPPPAEREVQLVEGDPVEVARILSEQRPELSIRAAGRLLRIGGSPSIVQEASELAAELDRPESRTCHVGLEINLDRSGTRTLLWKGNLERTLGAEAAFEQGAGTPGAAVGLRALHGKLTATGRPSAALQLVLKLALELPSPAGTRTVRLNGRFFVSPAEPQPTIVLGVGAGETLEIALTVLP